jgi:hypothetical protein
LFDDYTAAAFPLAPPPAAANAQGGSLAGAVAVSAAHQRFQSCRWRKPPENGTPDCCAHRDVLPLTGIKGFDPDAWCPDCRFYKVRRVPKKRTEPDDHYWRP